MRRVKEKLKVPDLGNFPIAITGSQRVSGNGKYAQLSITVKAY